MEMRPVRWSVLELYLSDGVMPCPVLPYALAAIWRQYGINRASYFLRKSGVLGNLAWPLSVGDLRWIGIKARNLPIKRAHLPGMFCIKPRGSCDDINKFGYYSWSLGAYIESGGVLLTCVCVCMWWPGLVPVPSSGVNQ